METRNITSSFKQQLNSSNVKHILLNYSEAENGHKHPDLPEGFICRDQFQVDMYAGSVRFILSGEGHTLSLSDFTSFYSNTFSINAQDIKHITLQNKYFNTSLWAGQQIPAIHKDIDISQYGLIGPSTYIQNDDGSTGTIVGAIPLNQIFDAVNIFQTDPGNMPSEDVEIHLYMQSMLKGTN